MLDLPGLEELLRGLHTRELSLVEVETQRASPFASSLLFDYVATYMYEGDTPNAERRAAALSLDRDLLRELLGQEELRELIDPAALEEVEADLQRLERAHARRERRRAARRAARARRPDRRRGAGALPAGGVRRARSSASSRSERRAVRMRIGGEERWIAAEDAGLYRDALGAVPPGGLPEAFLEEVEEPLRAARPPLRAHARARSPPREVSAPLRRRPRRRCCASWSAPATSSAASCAPAAASASGATPRCCAGCGAPRWRRCARRSSRPSSARSRASCRRGRAWTRAPPRRRRRGPAARDARAAPGRWRWRRRCGSATCCRAAWAPTRRPGWTSSARAASSSGSAPARSGAAPAGWRCYFREDARWLGPPPFKGEPPGRAAARRDPRAARRAAPRSGPTCWPTSAEVEPVELQEALWDLVWAGEVTNDAFAPLRAPRLPLAPARARARGRRFARRRRPGAPAGPGPLVAHRRRCSPTRPRTARACARSPSCCWSATGSSPARRCWPRASPAASPALYGELSNLETLGTARRGYFVEGLGGAQFALPAAIERLRGLRSDEPAGALVLAATDPANPYGATLPWPKRDDDESNRRPARVPGAYVVTLDAEPVLYVERGGKGLLRAARARRGVAAARRSRRSPTRCAAAGCRGSASSASTASRWWAPRPARS